ncbi:zinc knuckle CX2CX4HX4C containing protein [Tanacetum coccineum]
MLEGKLVLAGDDWKPLKHSNEALNIDDVGGTSNDASKGVDDVLENGPRMIRTIPIILKKWTNSTNLKKEELTRVLFWVKLHDVPTEAFTVDGLSAIATKIGKSFMIDS